ncbi:MAG: hypothetical protein HQK79_18860 [Desulfobacterales bacterium]|nr:hypothetical protein [Desulfobacterales bacterium]
MSNDKWLRYFWILSSLIFLIYLPAFILDFGIHNDYMIWSYENQKFSILGFPESSHLIYIGRPLGALLLNLHFIIFSGIKSLIIGRFIGYLTLILSFFLFCRIIITHYQSPPLRSLLIGLGIFTLPSVILYVIWLCNYIPGIFTILLSIIAYYLVNKGYIGKKISIYLIVSGYFLFFLSLLIYPPVSLFFLTFPFFVTLFSDTKMWIENRRKIFHQTIIPLILLGFYFFAAKYIITPLIKKILPEVNNYKIPTTNYEFTVGINFKEKYEVIKELFSTTFNLWSSNYIPNFFWLILLIILISLIVTGINYYKHEKMRSKYSLERVIFAIFLLGISAMPVIAPKGGFIAYRIILVPIVFVTILFFWSVEILLNNIKRNTIIVYSTFIFLTFIILGFGAFRIYLYTDNAHREYLFVKNSISKMNLSSINRITFLAPEWGDRIVDYPLFYDFNYIGTNFAFMDGLALCILKQNGITHNKINISYLPASARNLNKEFFRLFKPYIDMNIAGFQNKPPEFTIAMGPMCPNKNQNNIGAQLLIEDYNGYNIVLFGENIWGIPQGLFTDFSDISLLKKKNGVLWSGTVEKLMKDIDEIPPEKNSGLLAPRLIEKEFLGYNLVRVKGRFWGFPLGFKPDFKDPNLSQREGVVNASSIEELKKNIATIPEHIRNCLYGPRLLIEGFNSYNIVCFKGKLYGVKQGIPFDIADPEFAKKKGIISGTSIENIKDIIEGIFPNDLNESIPILIEEGYNGYNIVRFKGKILGFKQGFIPDYSNYNKLSQDKNVIVAQNKNELKIKIDSISPKSNRWRIWLKWLKDKIQ